ncbi:mitochondrial genome maintenance exonuclease 1 [Microcaecilia unicolor]|uniref:Mitochondrial genome maintenance exonuclease 1 n=1 Tax=Microcaecilia unicolor TaxID=1415580 RepID=A0A6P7XI32_9AMPH|nr:mitochondrial genome maintenance exonuclease 1 [Microcaecilia unicolor]XP_030052114.1 mitochondrial genome maintenance exonuclease 1 [Microcaecilia unicolor]XP_030052115.1 mitochondrial genome maintenance exonuclease 1 [Microcaecilia unicolor]
MLLLGMKPFQLLNKRYETLNILWTKVLNKEQLSFSTACCFYSKKKKANGYESINQEKYEDLVHSVTSSKDRARTPGHLFQEDQFLYGKVLKSKSPASGEDSKMPHNWIPLVNPDKTILSTEKTDPRVPLKISLPTRSQMTTKVPSVTHVLQQTMPMQQAFYLERWKQKMIMELGEEGFIAYTADIFAQGKLFHASLEAFFMSPEESVMEKESVEVSGYLASVQHVLENISRVKVLESAVQHEVLRYRGMVDCVAAYREKLCVIDWKTSEKPKPLLNDTFDNPLQVAAYIGAINHDNNYNFQVDCGLIVVAYRDGSPAHPHFMDLDLCSEYWNKWLLRLEEYVEKRE